MSLRLEMLQVARLAPTQLGEARDLVARFLLEQVNPDGGFRDRSGESDLYYTVFGLDALLALQEELPSERVAAYLQKFDDGPGLDFVHLACLARAWATIKRPLDGQGADAVLARLEGFRSADGGYNASTGAALGTAYAAFLALGAYHDCARPLPDPERVIASLTGLRSADGGYGNHPGMPSGVTPATAAAIVVLRHLDVQPDRTAGMWLIDRCHPRGGFFASPATPVPDLLSTATALHALTSLGMSFDALREPCLDFVDSLWTNRGGFYGLWTDDTLDCEYTYYGLLALGHLSLGDRER